MTARPLSDSELKIKKDMVICKYQELQANLLQSANYDYHKMKTDPSYRGHKWSEGEFQAKIQQICHNVAWMVFAQVNQDNNTEQLIDLSCLETEDAQAITKQKIYDLGKSMRMKPNSYAEDQVLVIIRRL